MPIIGHKLGVLLSAMCFVLGIYPHVEALAQGGGMPKSERSYAIMPDRDADHSAHRIDSEVMGWNKTFSEVAVVGLNVKRFAKGKQRGEVFLLIYDIHSASLKENVHLLYVTQADMPHDPIPIDDVRERTWGMGHGMQQMWPRKPKKKRPRAGMKITPLWHSVDLGGGLCSPSVGFRLNFRRQIRYQAHRRLKLTAPCQYLRMTDYRTYWAKKDLAASMLRFDYSATYHEKSARFPLTVDWVLGQELELEMHLPGAGAHPKQQAVIREMKAFGKVRKRKDSQSPSGVDYRAGYKDLAQYLAKVLELPLGNLVTGAHIQVKLTDDTFLKRQIPSSELQVNPLNDKASDEGYLDDFQP
jgi:hypothetical protein